MPRIKRIFKKLKKMKEIFYKLCHVMFGMLTVYSAKVDMSLPLIFFLTFLIYELDEEFNLGDHAIEELREYGVGLTIALLSLL